MAWIKIDDQFRNHPKVLAAGPLASWLYMCGLCYIARENTGDFIPTKALAEIGDKPNVSWLGLIHAGLWRKVQGGFEIADWLNCSIMPDKSTQEERKCREYKAWRRAVLADSQYMCQACGIVPSEINWLHAHHILPWATFPEKRFDRKNGIALCTSCHLVLHREMRAANGVA